MAGLWGSGALGYGALTSEGKAKVQDCWKGHDPELSTWILKSTEKERLGLDGASAGAGQGLGGAYVRSRGSELVRCFLNCSFRSLLTPMSWNIRCSLDVYSKPQACCWGTGDRGRAELQKGRRPPTAGAHLQFGDHAGFCIVAGAVLVHQALGQHLSVELLEDVFVLDVLEHNHLQQSGRGR